MKKTLLFGVLFCFFQMAKAQSPQPDSLRLWFSVSWNDSLKTVTLRPSVANLTNLERFFHYQIRITDATLLPGNSIQKLIGSFFISPGEILELTEKTLNFQPELDFNVYLYVLEEDFVIAAAEWNFDDAYSNHFKKPSKPKPTRAYLAPDNFEIDALVFNETRTPFGREFYRLFFERWQPPQNVSGYWITIREILTPGRYTIISVSLKNKELYQRYLIPRREFMETLATQTAEYLLSLLQNGEFDGGLTNEDLFGKDFGDGLPSSKL